MLNLRSMRDDDLLRELTRLVQRSRGVEAEVVAHIGEVELRRLYAEEACSSMFEYCRRILRLRENEAYLRITVARAAREYPVVLEMLRDGRLHLSGIARLAPHLTRENAESLLERASGMSHRDIRELVAELEPRPDVAAAIHKLPVRLSPGSERLAPGAERLAPGAERLAPGNEGLTADSERLEPGSERLTPDCGSSPQLGVPRVESDALNVEPRAVAPARTAVVEPLAPTRYLVRFTASIELRDKLERLQALMRSSVPDGDLARIIDIAVSEKLERIETKRFGRTKAPRSDPADTDTSPASRHIPAAVEATRKRARRRSMRLSRQVRAALRQAARPRVPPQTPLRPRRRPQPREPGFDVPGSQPSAC